MDLGTPPAGVELEALAGDVIYEYAMFRWATDGVMSGAAGSEEMRNGLVEVLLLHERNLLDFFTSTGQGDDLTVQHFVPGWLPAEDPATAGAVTALKADRLSINKRLMHMTAYRQRIEKSEDAQPVAKVAEAMDVIWAAFLARLPPDRRRWFAG